MQKMRVTVLSSLLLFTAAASAQIESFPKLERVWGEEAALPEGHKEHRVFEMPADGYRYADGVYTSVISRISFRMPVLGQDNSVSVREGVVTARHDGTVTGSKVVLLPGRISTAPGPLTHAAAFVVTRLKAGQPQDRESVLAKWESTVNQEDAAAQGVFYTRRETAFGSAIQIQALKRVFTKDFPFEKKSLKGGAVQSIGTTFLMVAEGDSTIELSQIFPCKALPVEDCKKESLASAEQLLSGIQEFLKYPKPL